MSGHLYEQWLEANQRYLAAALEVERAALARFAGPGGPSGEEAASALAAALEAMPAAPALERVRLLFDLTPFELRLLVCCAGAELDARFAQTISAAQREPSRPWMTFSLAMAALPDAHWSALSPRRPLRYWRLVELSQPGGLTTAALRIDERILHELVGAPQMDERLAGYLSPAEEPGWSTPSLRTFAAGLAEVWRGAEETTALPVIALSGADAPSRRAAAALACADLGLRLYEMPAHLLPGGPQEQEQLLRLWEREALLGGCALLIDWAGLEAAHPQFAALARLVESMQSGLILSGQTRWPALERPLVNLEAPPVSRAEQAALWRQGLGGADGLDLDRLTAQFNLSAPGIRAACAAYRGSAGGMEQLWQACREQARPRMDDLAQRIQSTAGWEDLVLPPLQEGLLRQLAAHVRRRDLVYEAWGFAARSSRGLGTSAVFAGPSGTGKTLAAEVLAGELQLDLYRIDLAAVVSKYIGETEKNLRRLFDAAEEGGAILFFDEADALFGRRSEVKDSHDRYANIEVSYLLQRMEAYRGLSILATNMPEALDPAFLRRVRFVVHFPFPAEEQRAEIWRRIFPAATPLDGLDYAALARLDVAGGSIYNIALHAAFLAAETGGPVRMPHILEAARGEFMRLEKPFPFQQGEPA